jgi:preprotein translocase subunit SecD
MKTLKYMFMGIMLFIFIPFCGSQTTVNNIQTIHLRSVTENASKKLLAKSKDILLRRLEMMSLQNSRIIQDDARSELVITIPDTINRGTLLDILQIQGHLNFYETINRQEVMNYFRKQSSGCIQDAFASLHINDSLHTGSEPVLGISLAKDTLAINSCFASKEVRTLLPKQVKLLWTNYPVENKNYFLYCISASDKTFNEQNILEAHADFANPDQPTLCISFKVKVWKLLQNTTIRNTNKQIALVIDNKVYFAPRISGEIPHGQISLTGSGLSKIEVRKIVAIISSGVLPLKFFVTGNNQQK